MRRRTFLTASSLAAAAAAGLASAQRAVARRVTWASTDSALGNLGFDAFKSGLRDHGYVKGRDITLSAVAFDGPQEAQERAAVDLGRRNPDVIVTQGPVVRTLQKVGTPLPVVFGFSGDPVAAGLIDSFARPARNMTGISFLAFDLVAKRMDLLKTLLPDLRRVAIVANPGHPGEPEELRVSKNAAAALALSVDYFPIRGASELDGVFAGVIAARSQAIVLFPDAGMMRLSDRFAAFGREQRVPAVSGWSIFAERGNVLSYGPDLEDCFRRLAFFVDRISRVQSRETFQSSCRRKLHWSSIYRRRKPPHLPLRHRCSRVPTR